jgi:hypothetical protein
VSGAAKRLTAACLVVLSSLAPGCGPRGGNSTPTQVFAVEQAPSTPGEIELSDAKATLVDGNIVKFEVHYRFTQGKPDKYYSCEVSFPGTPNHGVRMMSSWELKPEGEIKDGIVLSKPPVKSFEIHMSEAVSPQDGYKKISNVVSGRVE